MNLESDFVITAWVERKVNILVSKSDMSGNIKYVLSRLGYPTEFDVYNEMPDDDIYRIRKDIQDDLLFRGIGEDYCQNDYGDACSEALNFLYDVLDERS